MAKPMERTYPTIRGVITIKYTGTVESGANSAHKTMHNWLNAWAGSVGKKLYPGTLNLELDRKVDPTENIIFVKKWDRLFNHKWKHRDSYEPILIPAKLNEIDVWIFQWGWNNDSTTVEVIAEVGLRKKFNLQDGDIVDIEL